MRSFHKNKNSGLIFGGAIVSCVLISALAGWRLGAGGHVAETGVSAKATGLPKPALQKRSEVAYAPELPLKTEPPAVALPVHEPEHKPSQENMGLGADRSVVAAVAEEQVVQVDAAKPGNSLLVGGHYVSVEGYVPAAGGRGMALDVVMTPVGNALGGGAAASVANNGSAAPQTGSPVSAAAGTNESSALANSPRTGLTYEEELFRSKWGWASYGAAQRAAQWKQ